MKEFGDLENLPIAICASRAHPREAARADLEVGHADGVLIGHGERELARRLGNEPVGAVAVSLLEVAKALQPGEEIFGVIDILVVVQPFDAGSHDRPCLPGKIPLHAAQQVANRGSCRIRLVITFCTRSNRRFARARSLEAGAERGQARVGPDPAAADRRLEGRTLQGVRPSRRARRTGQRSIRCQSHPQAPPCRRRGSRAASRQAASSAAASAPSASAIFRSSRTRWLDAMSKVLSGGEAARPPAPPHQLRRAPRRRRPVPASRFPGCAGRLRGRFGNSST
jgi:hypothetical protein